MKTDDAQVRATHPEEELRKIPTVIVGGPVDGELYMRDPEHESVTAASGFWRYLYELDGRGRLVFTGERWLDPELIELEAEDFEEDFRQYSRGRDIVRYGLRAEVTP